MRRDVNDPMGLMPSRELVKRVSEKIGIPRSTVDSVLAALSEEIVAALRDNSRVKIKGIATLRLRTRPASDMYSPREGRKIHIPERTVITAEASRSLKNMVKNIDDGHEDNADGSVGNVSSVRKIEDNDADGSMDNNALSLDAHDANNVNIARTHSVKNDDGSMIAVHADDETASETLYCPQNDDNGDNDERAAGIIGGKTRSAVYTNPPREMVNKNGFKRGHRLVLSLGSSFGVGSGDVTRPSSDSQTDENHGDREDEDEEDHNDRNGKTGTVT